MVNCLSAEEVVFKGGAALKCVRLPQVVTLKMTFQAMDLDGNRQISVPEFCAALQSPKWASLVGSAHRQVV